MAKCPRCGSPLVHVRWEDKKRREVFRCSGCQAVTSVPAGYFGEEKKEKRKNVRKLPRRCAYPACRKRLKRARTGRPRVYCGAACLMAHRRLQANAKEASP